MSHTEAAFKGSMKYSSKLVTGRVIVLHCAELLKRVGKRRLVSWLLPDQSDEPPRRTRPPTASNQRATTEKRKRT